MPFRCVNRVGIFVTLLAFAFILPACGSKQKAVVAPEPPATVDVGPDDAGLTKNEMAALRTRGQLDRHVPEHAKEDIVAQYKYFLRKGRDTMCSFSKRSERYLAYARNVFKSRGMPEELANLAIIESGYRPDAVSPAGAAGAWQFMPGTGAKYGLSQDFWQDERLDPYHATEAAADYLQKLYNDFGDWPTAIAAYNAGEGKISRAREGTGGKDFYEVNALNHLLDEKTRLKDETRNYVPRFMAVTKIMRNLPELGFEPIEPENSPQVLRLTARPGTDLREFSRACKLDWSEFARMNQHHKRAITCTDRETFVYVPSCAGEEARKYLCDPGTAKYAGWQPVKIAGKRDSLEKISKRANVSLAQLQAANPGISRLRAGQVIIAPLAVRLSPKSMDIIAEAKKGASRAGKTGESHMLKSGETLFAVAKKYNVNIETLKNHNNISDPAKLKTGMTLRIPGKSAQVPQGGSSGKIGSRKTPTYTVKAKDSLWSIARRHHVSVQDLLRWNKGAAGKLKPGTSLVVAQE